MATDLQTKPEAAERNLGLGAGWLAKLMQAGAIGLICLMFYQDRHESLRAAAEDRQMFREELRAQRRALDKLTHAVEQLGNPIRRQPWDNHP